MIHFVIILTIFLVLSYCFYRVSKIKVSKPIIKLTPLKIEGDVYLNGELI